MMNAVPLPTAQGGAAAGFAAFLANMGQDAAGGEAGGFDLLLAETSPLPASLLSLATGSGPGEDAATAEADDAAATDAAPDAAMAEELLAALTPAIAGTAQPAAKAPAAAAFAEPAPDAPPSPLAAPKPAPASPMTAVLIAEPQQAAKPLDSGAAMTVLFTQAASEGAARIGETAQPAAVAAHTLDLSNDDVWIEQLARDIAATKSDRGDISFRLLPRHLGRLDVAMRVEDSGVALKLDTQHETTAKIVTAAQARLVDDLRQQGVRVTAADVTCTPDETGRHAHQQQEQGRASSTPSHAHLIETATETESREESRRPADRRGRFA
jgi:flagellar hook-length control protein FliK